MNVRKELVWVVGLAVGLFGCGKPAAPEAAEETSVVAEIQTAQVKVRNFTDALAIDGQFQVPEGSSAKLSSIVQGPVVKILVKEGDSVRKGQLLALVDTRVLAQQARSAASANQAAVAQAHQSQASYLAAKADQETQVRIATAALKTAIAERDAEVKQDELELKLLQAGPRPQEVAAAEQALQQAKVAMDKAKVDADRDAKLLAAGFVSKQQADTSRAAYEGALAAFTQAQAQLDLVKAGARAEEREAAQAKLRSAKETGAARIAQAELALRQAKQGVLALDAKAAETQVASLSAAEKNSDAMAALEAKKNGEVHAPFDGVISRRFANPGDVADPTVPMFEISTKGALIDFVGQVAPSDATRLAVGMAGTWKGVVGRLVAIGLSNGQTGLAPARFRFPATGVHEGTFGTVFATVRQLNKVCVVPKQAVIEKEGKNIVFVVEEGKAKQTEVSVGPSDDKDIAVLTGLKPGQEVVTVGQFELSDGDGVEVVKK